MKANAAKCHFLLSDSENLSLNVNNEIISNSASEKLLGVTITNEVNFENILIFFVLKLARNCMR